jgi:hypothetical protein
MAACSNLRAHHKNNHKKKSAETKKEGKALKRVR